MRMTRIFQELALAEGLVFEVSSCAANHLVRVLRCSVGDAFFVFNGEGGQYTAKIISIQKQQVIAQVQEYQRLSVESALKINLAQAISRGEKMDYTIQKAVELGVTEIVPILTERCGVKLSGERWDKKINHWQGVITAACEQSGRDYVPIIHYPISFAEYLIKVKNQNNLKLILQPQGAQKLRDLMQQPESVALLIGPEGGFSEVELQLAQQHDFIALCFGPRVLRTETAALVGITALQSKWGDLS